MLKAGLVLAASLIASAVAFAVPAHATAGVFGMCDSSLNSQECWRQAGSGNTGTYLWARDISGDSLQHYSIVYDGDISEWPTQCVHTGLSGTTGVYVFVDNNNPASVIGAGYEEYVGEDPNFQNGNPSPYDLWGWASDGRLVNCGQSAYWGAAQALCGVTEYTQLYVRNFCGTAWTSVDPPAKRR